MPELKCSLCGAPTKVEAPKGSIVAALQTCYPLCAACYVAQTAGLCEQCCGDDCECSCHKEAHADTDPVRA